jgi:hypothetical protein
MADAGNASARELTQRYAERAMCAVVALAKTGKSARVRVSAAKTVLRGDTTLAEKKVAVEALVDVMDAAKSESARLSAAKEILRMSRAQPADKPGAAAPSRDAAPLPPALAKLLSQPPPGRAAKPWQRGTALVSGTVQVPR